MPNSNQRGLIPPVIIIGAVLIIGAILIISNFNKINLVNIPLQSLSKGSNSWLYKVDLTKCQPIIDRAGLGNELQASGDKNLSWQHRCSLLPKQAIVDAIGLNDFVIDAIYDEQGVIDPVGNATKFKSKDPIIDWVDQSFIGKNYQDIYQEPKAINKNFSNYEYSIQMGYSQIEKQGTFPTSEGKGAYVIIRNNNEKVDFVGYSHTKKGSCNIVMMTDPTSNKDKLEGLLVELVQKIDQAIQGECGKNQ